MSSAKVTCNTFGVAAAVVLISFILGGCAASGPHTGSKVTYGNAKDVEQVNSQWGSTDLQTVAETMARSLAEHGATMSPKPLVTIADVKNKTSEYIDTRAVTDTIRVQLMKSGTMKFATDIAAMQAQTDELQRQNNSGLYKKSSTAKVGNMQAAKYRIEGNIISIVKRNSDVKDVYYKFSLIMTDIESGVIEWADEKEIRKSEAR